MLQSPVASLLSSALTTLAAWLLLGLTPKLLTPLTDAFAGAASGNLSDCPLPLQLYYTRPNYI